MRKLDFPKISISEGYSKNKFGCVKTIGEAADLTHREGVLTRTFARVSYLLTTSPTYEGTPFNLHGYLSHLSGSPPPPPGCSSLPFWGFVAPKRFSLAPFGYSMVPAGHVPKLIL
ncbi:MAG: hypothetical protein NW226_27515 [Microscillaceae bacterium]|nr:hypothetical protein [Microscillaceae bacterium]